MCCRQLILSHYLQIHPTYFVPLRPIRTHQWCRGNWVTSSKQWLVTVWPVSQGVSLRTPCGLNGPFRAHKEEGKMSSTPLTFHCGVVGEVTRGTVMMFCFYEVVKGYKPPNLCLVTSKQTYALPQWRWPCMKALVGSRSIQWTWTSTRWSTSVSVDINVIQRSWILLEGHSKYCLFLEVQRSSCWCCRSQMSQMDIFVKKKIKKSVNICKYALYTNTYGGIVSEKLFPGSAWVGVSIFKSASYSRTVYILTIQCYELI